jgi:hypothetical protein
MKEIKAKDIKVGFRFDEHGSWFKEVVEVIKKSADKLLVKVIENDGFIQYITFNVEKGVICDGKSMCYAHTTCREDALYFFGK